MRERFVRLVLSLVLSYPRTFVLLNPCAPNLSAPENPPHGVREHFDRERLLDKWSVGLH
jgi:hypothetical protein